MSTAAQCGQDSGKDGLCLRTYTWLRWLSFVLLRVETMQRMSSSSPIGWVVEKNKLVNWNAGLDEGQAGNKIAGRNISNLKYADDTTLMAENEEELKKASWWKWKRRGKKLAYSSTFRKLRYGIWSHHSMGNRWGNSENSVSDFGAPKSLQMVIAAVKLKDTYSLKGELWPT